MNLNLLNHESNLPSQLTRIRDLQDKRLYVPDASREYPALARFLGEKINTRILLAQWPEILRLATSIKQGTVTASLMLRKLDGVMHSKALSQGRL